MREAHVSSRAVYRLIIAISATTATTLPVFLTGSLAVQIRHDLHFSIGDLGVIVAVYFGAAALLSVLSGSLAERFGGELIMRLAVTVSALSLISVALFANSFWMLLFFLFFAGVSNGANQPAANIFVINAVPKERRGFGLGVKQAAIPLSTLLAGLAVPTIALTIGWRYAYAISALFAVVVAFAIPSLEHKKPDDITDKQVQERPRIAIAPILTLSIAIGLGLSAANALGAFLVTNAVHAHFSPGDAGLLASLGSASGLISRIFGGYLADRRSGRHLVVIAAMLGIGALGYTAFALGDRSLIVLATVVSYAAGWGWNGVFNFAVVLTHPGAEGRATGTTQAGAYVGSVVGPLVFGWVVDHESFAMAWTLCALAALASALLMLLGRYLLLKQRRNFVSILETLD